MPQRPWLALGATVAVQLLASFCLSAAPVLAPAVAPQLRIAPASVGLFVGTAYLFAMVSGLASGNWVARWGAPRLSQWAVLLMGLGVVVASAGHALLLLVAAALMGTAYGCINPAAAAILAYHAPPSAPALFFSLKQAAVPLGVAVSGLLMPIGLVALGWQPTVWLIAVACALLAAGFVLLLAPLRQPGEQRADGGGPSLVAALADVMRVPALRRLSLVSLAYAITQQCFLAFIVSLLHLELAIPLALAAGLLAASQAASAVVRIVLGHVADRWVAPRVLLGALGLAMSASCLALALMPGTAGIALVAVAVLACGASSTGWNGVFFAELLRNTPRERMAASAGGTQFFTFAGATAGPFLFAEFVRTVGAYAPAYFGVAAISALGAIAMLRRPPGAALSAAPGRRA